MDIQLIAYPQGTTEPLTYPTGEVILDLYKDEPIPLVLNADDFTNVAEKASSYSKSFEIPGTKTNNLFFNHIYEITADSDFNTHTKTKVKIKEDSIDIFSGYLQLNEIINKGEDISYEITIFSESVNLKDTLSGKVMRDLDLSELNHTFDEDNIKDSWTGNLTLDNTLPVDSFAGSGTSTDVLKYPFVKWNNDSFVNMGTSSIVANVKSDIFRPFVNLKYIIQNILRDVGYSFTSTFLNTTAFTKLFVDFNKGWYIPSYANGVFKTYNNNTTSYSPGVTTKIEFNNIDNTANIVGSNYYDTTTKTFTCTAGTNHVQITTSLDFIASMPSNNITLGLYKNGALIYTLWNGGVSGYLGVYVSFYVGNLSVGDTIEVKMLVNGSFSATLDSNSYILYSVASESAFMNDNLKGYKGNTNQWEFLKDIITKYNLLIMADDNNPNNLFIEPYKDWVDAGNEIDWTNKIDDTEIKYTPIDGLAKRLIFRLSTDEPDWITTNHNYPNTWRYPYNQVNDIEIFDNAEQVVEAKEFSSTNISRFEDREMVCPMIIDKDYSSEWDNKWRMLYDIGVQTLQTDDITSYQFDATEYLLFSPANEYPTTSNTLSVDFGVVNYDISGADVLNGLYNIYWAKYIDELYHKDTRIAEMKILLTAKDLSTLNYNDIIRIKNKKFRIKKIEYKSGAMSKLQLITIKDL